MTTSSKKIKNSSASKLKSDVRKSKHNYEFDVYHDVWKLNADYSINFSLLASLKLTSQFETNFRLALADYASEFSSGYVTSIYINIRHLFAFGVTDKIMEEHVINFKATLEKNKEWKLGQVRSFILDWYEKEIKGVDKKVVDLLSSVKLAGTEKGKAVALGCPYSGAYSFDEQVAFISWYVDAYSLNQITLTEYAFVIALQQTGARPIQLRYLYYCDWVAHTEGSITSFSLRIPHAKKLKADFRESFQFKDDINEDLFLVLAKQAEQSVNYIEDCYNTKLSELQKNTIPVFLNKKEIAKIPTLREFYEVQANTPDLLCLSKSGASNMIRNIARLCPLKTTRIIIEGIYGDLHVNARRFRYTHATNMAVLGASAHTIAEELGHEDTQHVTVYTEFNEEMADRLDEALASDLTPLAQAFSGTLIDSEKDAIRANDPRSRVNNNDGNPVGNCGKFGFCANGTIHCYTCNKFQPWLNAPHTEVLKSVVSVRDRKRKRGASEFVLQGHNRSIDAIKVVIQKCNARKQEQEKEGSLNV